MIVAIFIICIILAIVLPYYALTTESKLYWLLYPAGMSLMMALFLYKEMTSVQPIDVYRGNTELIIHSINGVPTDTVVVFKTK